MDAGPRIREVARPSGGELPWTRATLTWMLFMLAETVHGATREIFIAPAIGALRARQWGVLMGSLIVVAGGCALAGWMRATTQRAQFVVGGYWVVLTVIFELSLGRAGGASWSRILSDYDPTQGGFMLLGLGVMFLAPWLGAQWLKFWRR